MPFEKGKSGNPNGRPSGALNKDTAKFKEALNTLLEESADEMINWLAEIENPKDRFNVIKDLAEYIHPKLARQEHKHEGKLEHDINWPLPQTKLDE